MWERVKTNKKVHIALIVWILLAIPTIVMADSIRTTGRGAANSSVQVGEIEVIWFNGYTPAGDTLRISCEVETGSIDIYVVTQDGYNRSSGEIPESYLLHHSGGSTVLYLDGPLPFLYFVVLSPVNQQIYVLTSIYPPIAMMSDVLLYPCLVGLIAMTVIVVGLVWKTQREG